MWTCQIFNSPRWFSFTFSHPMCYCKTFYQNSFIHYYYNKITWMNCKVFVSGGRPKGSKCNLNFKMPHGIISNIFKIQLFSLVAFLSQHLNYFTIIIWIVFNYINSKKNSIVVNLLNINLRRFWNKVVFVPSWLWTCIAHPIYLLEKNKLNPIVKWGKILIPFIILGVRPTSILGPFRDQLVDLIRDENHCMTLKERESHDTWQY